MNADDIFATALDIADPAERSAYLDRACAGNEPLRRDVDSLLAAHQRLGPFLQKRPTLLAGAGAALGVPPSGGPMSRPAEAGTPNAADEAVRAPFAEQPGDRIGRYKLIEPIGEGGMGVVWMAEQEEPVRRRVALKIIKPGMDSRQVIARFEAERQALALMDHPNIAQFHDAGVTGVAGSAGVSPASSTPASRQDAGAPSVAESQIANRKSEIPQGRPYFVMELVQGIPITRFCEAAKLSTRERLELVAQVCRAVQHAHQKGIIHRDLKPSNLLVTEQDGRPVPKVIDFGVAKATGARLTDKTIFTGFAQLIGTPDYMSPEQAGLGSLDIDTRSDIYSLGVLLYELLTGHTPFDTKDLLKSGFEAVLRTIREVDPPKPSTRLTQELLRAQERKGEREKGRAADPVGVRPSPGAGMSDEQGAQACSQAHVTSSVSAPGDGRTPVLNRPSSIDPDLDWIVMKCLEKDRARRYETANALAQDLDRYLHDEPVTARPPSLGYRCRKFARKHRAAVAAAAGFVVLLTTATVVSTTLALWANHERRRAEQATAVTRAEQHKATQARDAERDARLREEQQRKAAEAAQARAVSAESEARENERQAKLAGAKAKESERTAKESEAEARAVLRFFQDKVLAAARPEGQEGGLGREATIRAAVDAAELFAAQDFTNQPLVEASVRNVLGKTYHYLGDDLSAIRQFERALALAREWRGRGDAHLFALMNNLALAYQAVGRDQEAIALLQDALGRSKAEWGENSKTAILHMNSLARLYLSAGKLTEAVPLFEEAVKRSKAVLGPDHSLALVALDNLGAAYSKAGRVADALPLHEESQRLHRAKYGVDHPDTLKSMNNLALAYRDMGRLKDALPILEQVVTAGKAKLGPDHPDTLIWMGNQAETFRKLGRLPEAIALFEEALRIIRAKPGTNHSSTIRAMDVLAEAYLKDGRPAAAVPIFEESWSLRKANLGAGDPKTLRAMNNLAMTYQAAGRFDKAVPLMEECVQLSKIHLGPTNASTLERMRNLVSAYFHGNRFTNAVPIAEETLKLAESNLGIDDPFTLKIMHDLASSYHQARRWADALPLFQKTLNLRTSRLGPDHADTLKTMYDLAVAHMQATQFVEAEGLFRHFITYPAVRADSARYTDAIGFLGESVLRQGRFADAERSLREYVSRLEAAQPARMVTLHAQSLLGEALVGLKRYAEAQPLLEQAFDGLQRREASNPSNWGAQVHRETVERLVQLYEDWGKSDQAAAWREKLR